MHVWVLTHGGALVSQGQHNGRSDIHLLKLLPLHEAVRVRAEGQHALAAWDEFERQIIAASIAAGEL